MATTFIMDVILYIPLLIMKLINCSDNFDRNLSADQNFKFSKPCYNSRRHNMNKQKRTNQASPFHSAYISKFQ